MGRMNAVSPRVTVFHADDLPPNLDVIGESADVRTATAADLPAALGETDVLLTWDFLTPVLRDVDIAATPIRWIHTASAGIDNVLTPAVAASDIAVTNSRGVFDRPIAEYVLGLVLTYTKDLHGSWRRQQERRWEHRETTTLTGKQALVVGVGPIGREIARMLSAVGLRVRGVGRTERSGDPDFGEVYASADLVTLVPDADFVVLVTPLTESTRGMVDSRVLAAMRPSARLINVGRGDLIVEPELVQALADGWIAGAALDVFHEEPLPASSPLWANPEVLISPHMSADTVGWLDDLAELFLDNLRRWNNDQPLRNVVDKQLGYVRST